MNVVAYQGAPGAYSEEAALACCGRDVQMLPQNTFDDVVQAVLAGRALWGILPLENSLIGPIEAANAALNTPALKIVREVTLPIHHCLLANPGATVASVRTAVSHPAALAQCRRFLEAHPHIAAVDFYDTAGAAKHVVTVGDIAVAAIASRRAAERYGLALIATDIEDRNDNRTRFVMVVKQ